MKLEKVNLAEKFGLFRDHWTPRVVGSLNGQHVKVVKLLGEFVWHHHQEADELFLVVKGSMRLELRDGSVDLAAGDFLIVPRGVEHRTVADKEAWVMLFEPAGTINTGNVREPRTVDDPSAL